VALGVGISELELYGDAHLAGMKIIEKLASSSPAFSFEFFPPKDAEGTERLFRAVAELRPYEPTYVSVTYGAGGSTRRLTVDLVRRIQREVGLEAMAHLTCVGASCDEISQVLDELAAGGIDNVLALRGDPPKGDARFEKPEGGFAHANELIEFVRSRWSFCVGAACYPETHVESPSRAVDLENLQRKVVAGADFLVTQLFFEAADYFRFVEEARAIGIACPIVPGIMPITNVSQIKRFTAMCGAHIPRTC
jgi:methylenetetrahydrofolate reductase (NADPH)